MIDDGSIYLTNRIACGFLLAFIGLNGERQQ